MKLELTNVNKIGHACVEFGGLTVIAGINDSGKSTVGKTLFSVIKALIGSEGNLTEYKIRAVSDTVSHIYRKYHLMSKDLQAVKDEFFPPKFLSEITPFIEAAGFNENSNRFNRFIEEKRNIILTSDISQKGKEDMLFSLNEITEAVMHKDSTALLSTAFQRTINSEFMGNICSEQTNTSVISLSDNNNELSFTITDNNVVSVRKDKDFYSLLDDITFLETPLYLQLCDLLSRTRSVFDVVNGKSENRFAPVIPFHIKDLINKLELNRYGVRSPFSHNINSEIESIIGGRFVFDQKTKDFLFFTEKNEKKVKLHSINVASGIKTFGIIQLLLDAGELNTGKMLIIDEPENHLHPKWQIELACLVVNLAKKGIPLMISSHSPYFIQGIRFFAHKEQIENIVNYYLAEENESNLSTITDVTSDLNKIFVKLAEPLNKIMNLQ